MADFNFAAFHVAEYTFCRNSKSRILILTSLFLYNYVALWQYISLAEFDIGSMIVVRAFLLSHNNYCHKIDGHDWMS